MASKSVSSIALLLTINLLFFTLVSSTHHNTTPCPPPPPPPPKAPKLPSPAKGTCPIDTLKLGVCANLLNDLLHRVIGTPPKKPCCPLLENLVDLEAAVCLCTPLKANVLGLNLNFLGLDTKGKQGYSNKESVKGNFFFLETDIKAPPLKLDNTGKSILTCPPPSSKAPKAPSALKSPSAPKLPSAPNSPSPPAAVTCSIDTLKPGVCADLLNDLLRLVIGTPSKTPCCPLLDGLVDLEAPICLCTALKANVLAAGNSHA